MTWQECFAELDVHKLRKFVVWFGERLGLFDLGFSAEALVVDVVYASWVKFEQFDPKQGSFQTWVTNWARSVLDRHRRQSLIGTPLSPAIVDPTPGPLEQLIRREELAHAEEVIRRVRIAVLVVEGGAPATELQVIDTYQELLTDGERVNRRIVAEQVGLSTEGVRKALIRIRQKCKICGISV